MYELRSTRAYRTSFKRISRHKHFSLESYDKVIDLLQKGMSFLQNSVIMS
jgi:mRNA-degrading endonuclease YafQ of YafQ-DinJ toxin-antitoxin module